MGLEDEQIKVLKNCFDGFADEDGAIPADNIGNILEMMGLKGNNTAIMAQDQFDFAYFLL